MSRPPAAPRAVVVLTAALAASAVAAAIVDGLLFPSSTVDWPWVVPAVGLLVAGASFQIRFRYRDEIEALDFFEAVLAPVLFAFAGWIVVAAVLVANALAEVIRRNERIKGAFNAVQWTAAAGAGVLVYSALRDGRALTWSNVGALSAAMLVVLVVNHLAFAGVVAIVQRHSLRQVLAGLRDVIVPGWLIAGGMNLAFGILFVAAYDWSPALLPLFFVPLVALHWAGAAYAAARADEVRLRALHRASAHLAAAVEPLETVGAFLEEVRACFESEAAELVVVDGTGVVEHRTAVGAARLAPELTDTLLALREPARLRAQAGQPEGWRDCLAAPLVDGGRPVGVLTTYNRTGLEGFEDGELAVLSALADDVVAALQRGRLVQRVVEERRKLSDIVDSASDGIFTVAADGTVENWNPAMENITGYTAEHVVGRQDLGMLRARDDGDRHVLLERWAIDHLEGDRLPSDLHVLTRTGEARWLSCSYSRVRATDGAGESLVVIARDVTKVREVERLRDDFVATVSHELRTPLSPIKGWASTLLEFGDKLDESERRDALQSILRQSQRLERLIVNLLEVSKIEHGSAEAEGEDVDVAAITQRVLNDFRMASPQRVLHLDGADAPAWARTKELWFEQILTNLLSNAVKYSDPESAVEVTVEPGLDKIRVVVVDHGCGIPAHELDRIFERFHRVRETTTQTGTGLGLYIARQLAHEIGGEVSVTSVPGRGSRFTLEIPAAPRVVDVRRADAEAVVRLEAG